MASPVTESLRGQVREALENAGIPQTLVALKLGVSTKYLSQMLTGRALLTLEWAEKIVNVCDMRVEVVVLKGGR